MQNEIVIFSELTTEQKLTAIEEQSKQYQGLVVDMNKKDERKKVKDSALLINEMLTKLNRLRIDKAKDYKDKVEAEAKLIRERLETANKPLTVLIDAHAEEQKKIREAEKARQETIQAAFDKLNDSALEAIGQTSTVIEVIIEDIQDYSFDPDVFQERTDEAIRKQSELLGKLDQMLKGAIAQEETEAKLAKLAEMEEAQRIADEAKAKAEREAEIAAKAIEDYKIQQEQAAQKAEADRIERENQAALHAEQAKLAEQSRAEQKANPVDEAEALREMQSSYSESEGAYEKRAADYRRRIFAPIITKSDAVAVNDVERELTEIEQAYADGFKAGLNFKGIKYDGIEVKAAIRYTGEAA